MSGFSSKQQQQLRRNVSPKAIKTRVRYGREISYLEGWFVLSEANRIFGFDGWTRETLETRQLHARELRGQFTAAYLAKVRVSVTGDGSVTVREAHGTGEAKAASAVDAHDMAIKAAETDATKRAFATFGKPFGLALYGTRRESGKEVVAPAGSEQAVSAASPDLMPAHPEMSAATQDNRRQPIGMLLPKPRRIRDRNHLRFVAAQPCLICGRQPSDAHHVKFAQFVAIGMKVSDEFVVPLCRGHHRELHQAGNEENWWTKFEIAPLQIAKQLWLQSHGVQILADSETASTAQTARSS